MRDLKKILAAVLSLCLVLGGCGSAQLPDGGAAPSDAGGIGAGSAQAPGDQEGAGGESDVEPLTFDTTVPEGADSTFSVTSDVSGGVVRDEQTNTWTITAAGEYTCTGDLIEGQLVVDAGEDDAVIVNLSGCLITNSAAPPVSFLSADKVELSAKKDTENKIWDQRVAAEGEDPSGGAVYAKCDLTLKGNGSLEVVSTYNNGVHTKDDLKIKNLTLTVMAVNTALRGNDSVTVESGTVVAISSGGDAVKTTSTDLNKNGEQRGCVNILGGTVTLYASGDGIDAAVDVNVSGDAVLDIYTDTYSPYSTSSAAGTSAQTAPGGGTAATGSGGAAWGLSASTGPDGVSGATGQTDPGAMRGGKSDMGTPDGAQGFDRGSMKGGMTDGTPPDGVSGATGQTDPGAMHGDRGDKFGGTAPDAGTSGGQGGFDRGGTTGGNFDRGGMKGGMGSSNKTQLAWSCKGIKAANAVNISGGTVTIHSTDDGVHANFDEELESTGSKGLGNVTISGGTVTVESGDDGVHADQDLTLSGGAVNVLTSYEGLEANRICLSGGTATVYASDDAVNANSKGAYQGYIEISGGYLDASVPSGDTDTLDSNGTILVSGGLVLLKNGQTGGRSMAGGTFDAARGVSVTGGTVVAIGCIGEQPQGAVSSTTQSFSAGDYTLQDPSGNVLASFTLSSSYKGYILCSDQFTAGQTYTVYQGTQALFSFKK